MMNDKKFVDKNDHVHVSLLGLHNTADPSSISEGKISYQIKIEIAWFLVD